MAAELRCEIVAWLDDKPFPGWVEARIVDAHGRACVFHDKPPIFSERCVTASTDLPLAGVIGCEVLATRVEGRRTIATVDTEQPCGIEALDGSTRFEVDVDQLRGFTR